MSVSYRTEDVEERLKQRGGAWLAAVRSKLQWRGGNGSTVTWGSNEPITPPLTVAEVEEIAAAAVAAHITGEAGATNYNVARLFQVMTEILECHPDDLDIPVVTMVANAALVASDIVASDTFKVSELRLVEARLRKLADWPEDGE
jgi:hypothetical protein